MQYDINSELQLKIVALKKQYEGKISELKNEHNTDIYKYDAKYKKYIEMNKQNQNIKLEDEKMKVIIRKELDESKQQYIREMTIYRERLLQ